MADQTKNPQSGVGVPLYGEVQASPFPKNPVGLVSDPETNQAYKDYLRFRQEYADSLEQRYAQPNWFNIAGALLKPQLGGFVASLGSAGTELGAQVEAQRAMAPTIARMRSEIALGQADLAQRMKAAQEAERAAARGFATPQEAGTIEAFTSGPGGVAKATESQQAANLQKFIAMLQAGSSRAELESKFGKKFVDDAYKTIPALFATQPQPMGAGAPTGTTLTPTGGVAASEVAPSKTQMHIPGVPTSMTSELPVGPQIQAQAQSVQARQEEVQKINTLLTNQATQAAPIFEVSTNLYKAAAKPSLAPAFGIFEGSNPMAVIGTALESGSFPNVLANMRKQIIQARLGPDKEKRALSDFQVFEGVLADLQTKMQNGVINPTDVRTMFESASVPGIKNSQDAFLRGVSRIGSDALNRYENKLAFERALQDKNFDVMNWAGSKHYQDVQENAKNRVSSLIGQPASYELPKFMREGLPGAYQPKKAPAPSSIPKASDWEDEAKRRGLR